MNKRQVFECPLKCWAPWWDLSIWRTIFFFARSLHFRRGASWELVIIIWRDIGQVCAQVPVKEESTEEGLLTQSWILGCGGCSGILVTQATLE